MTAWAAGSQTSGTLRRPLTAPSGTNHRAYRCETTGTDTVEPTWPTTKDSTVVNEGITWREVSGLAAYNTTSFAAPHYWLQHAVSSSWSAVGDTIYVDDDHYQLSAAATNLGINCVGTNASPTKIICITSTFSNPPVTGEMTTTAVGINVSTQTTGILSFTGSYYCYGLHFNCGTGANDVRLDMVAGTSSSIVTFDNCVLEMGGTAGGSMFFCSSFSKVILLNPSIKFNSATSTLNTRGGYIYWRGGGLIGAVIPTGLFGDFNFGDNGGGLDAYGVDFNSSGTWTSKYLFAVTAMDGMSNAKMNLVNCKTASTLAGVTTGTIPAGTQGFEINFLVSDSSTTTYREERYQRCGSLVADTVNYRNSGTSDGTTPKSWKVVTLTTSNFTEPYICPEIYQWVDSTGAKTVRINMAQASGATKLQSDDIYMDVEYMGTASTPLGTAGTTKLKFLDAGADLSDDVTSTWAGLSTPVLQYLTKSITVENKGFIRVRIGVIKVSTTVYIDPLIVVT